MELISGLDLVYFGFVGILKMTKPIKRKTLLITKYIGHKNIADNGN